jgi:hypothetical protein
MKYETKVVLSLTIPQNKKGGTMKTKGKIALRKIKIQRLVVTIDRDEQKQIKSGSVGTMEPIGITSMPIFCKI